MFKNKVSMPVVASSGGGGVRISRETDIISLNITNREYTLGEFITGESTNLYNNVISYITPISYQVSGDAAFIITYNCQRSLQNNAAKVQLVAICVKAGLAKANEYIFGVQTIKEA